MSQLGALRANRMARKARAAAEQGDYATAIAGLEEALALARKIGQVQLVASVSGYLATLLPALGQETKALEIAIDATATAAASGALQEAGRLAAISAGIHQNAGRCDQAMDWYSRAVTLSDAAGDQISVGRHLYNQGVTLSSAANTEEALRYWEMAAERLSAASDQEGLVAALMSLAVGYGTVGRHVDAVTALRALMGPLRRTGDRSEMIGALRIMREELQHAGNWDAAADACRQLLSYADETERALVGWVRPSQPRMTWLSFPGSGRALALSFQLIPGSVAQASL